MQGRFDFVLGGYVVADLLAFGDSEWIYAAKDLQSGQPIVLKALQRPLSGDPSAVLRLEKEARLGGLVDHWNIVRTRCFCKTEDSAYLVMDLVEGVTLAELIALHREIPWSEACNYVFQAAVGLARLHDAGLVHGDVEPANLLIEREADQQPPAEHPRGDRRPD